MRYCYFSYSRNCSAQNEKMRDNENNSRLPLIRPFFADHQYSCFPVQTNPLHFITFVGYFAR